MKLKSAVTVSRNKEQVWDFLKEPTNLAKWDKNVEEVIPTSTTPIGTGYSFYTIASAQPGQIKGAKMSYRVIEYVPYQKVKIVLLKSRIFKNATWTLLVESKTRGTLVMCEVDLTFRLKYIYLIPILLFSKRGKLLTDLEHFEKALENSLM